MSAMKSLEIGWQTLPARTRALLASAVAVLAFVFVYHAAISPLVAETKAQRARHAENFRKLSAVERTAESAHAPSAFAGKTLRGLSAARVVEALTQAAHRNGIQRITFKTGPTAAVPRPADESAPRENAARMPVSVEIEAQGGDFAAYLEGLAGLPIPLSIETFEMKVDRTLDPALRIRMELEIYGTPA